MTALVILFVIGCAIWGFLKRQQLRRAKEAYERALARLTATPADNQLRIAALSAGRRYVDLAREAARSGRRGVFDELALNNDLSARSAAGSDDVKACPRCAEGVKRAAAVCRFCQYDFAGARTAA